MVRRSLFLVAASFVALLAVVACEPAPSPPSITSLHGGPLTYGPDRGARAFASASEGDRRVAVWADEEALRMDRFDGSTVPIDAVPITLDRGSTAQLTSWGNPVVVLGGGSTFVAVDRSDYAGPRDVYESQVLSLRDPSGRNVPLRGDARNDLRACADDPYGYTSFRDVAWNGSTFLWALACTYEVDLFTISPSGLVTRRGSVPAGTDYHLDLAGTDGTFLATYERGSNIYAWRISGAGQAVGSELLLADEGGGEWNPVAAASGGRYLVAWERQAAHGHEAVARTVQTNGVRGPEHDLNDGEGGQTDIALAGRSDRTWQAAWTDESTGGDGDEVIGTAVTATGTPVDDYGRILASGPGDQSRPSLETTSGLGVLATWLDDSPGYVVHRTRRVDADGDPIGVTSQPTRAPFSQPCPDVAAGDGQFLVTWQESRVIGDTNLYAQRYGPGGDVRGGPITLSRAAADQFCPTAAWDGSHWLVAWTDLRNGTKDVYGALVSGTGAVTPSAGFPISARASEQQSPAVTWNGTDFVVAWNDLRNGDQDIYAARVSSDGSVREPNGLAVTTATGPQRSPSIASTAGRTLIAWDGAHRLIEGRTLRPAGTFTGGVVRLAKGQGMRAAVAGGAGRFALLYAQEYPPNGDFPNVVVKVFDATDGSSVGTALIEDLAGESKSFDGGDIAFDGTRFVLTSGTENGGYPSATTLASVTGTTPARGDGGTIYGEGRISALPDGRSLLVSTLTRTLTVATVDDAP